MGTGCPNSVFGNKQGHKLRPDQKKRTSKGMRFAKFVGQKLGRKSVIEWAKVEIKKWISDSEEDGHGLEDTDVLCEFEEVLSKRLFELIHEEGKDGLEKEQLEEKKVIAEKLQTLAKPKSRSRELKRLLVSVGSRVLRPARRTCLTKPEEEKRCHLTWQQFDFVLQAALLGSETQDIPG
jgi:hypothetical protein